MWTGPVHTTRAHSCFLLELVPGGVAGDVQLQPCSQPEQLVELPLGSPSTGKMGIMVLTSFSNPDGFLQISGGLPQLLNLLCVVLLSFSSLLCGNCSVSLGEELL